MFEKFEISKKEKITQLCNESKIEVVNDCADLTQFSFNEVMSFFDTLTSNNDFLIHGTNSNEVYSCLETRQAHCLVKESGRKKAVYATEIPRVALSIAVLNRSYLKKKFGNYIFGHSGDNFKLVFKVPTEIYDLFVAHDPNLFTDGYVYILDRANFVNAPDAGSEWHSESDQEPLLACKVSKVLAGSIYIICEPNNTVIEFDFKSKYDI